MEAYLWNFAQGLKDMSMGALLEMVHGEWMMQCWEIFWNYVLMLEDGRMGALPEMVHWGCRIAKCGPPLEWCAEVENGKVALLRLVCRGRGWQHGSTPWNGLQDGRMGALFGKVNGE